MGSLEGDLGRAVGNPDLGEQAAANAYAGTSGLSTHAALNEAAGYTRGSYRGLLAVLRELAGLPSAGEGTCLQAIGDAGMPGGALYPEVSLYPASNLYPSA